MAVVLQGFVVLLKVKVGISQLAVDGTKYLKVLCSNLDGRLKEGHTGTIVTRLTEPLPFQSQVQTRVLHPARRGLSVRCKWELYELFYPPTSL